MRRFRSRKSAFRRKPKVGTLRRRKPFGSRRRKVNRRPSLSYMGPGRAPLPDKYITKLTYQDFYNIPSGGVSGIVDQVFRGNSVFDPDFSGVGRGCNGFTELSGIYNVFRVYASKIEVQMKSLTDATSTGDFIGMIFADRSNATYSMNQAVVRQGQPFCVSKMCNRYGNGNTPTSLKQFRRTKDIYGETDIDDDAYSALTTTNPVNGWYWHVVAARQDQSGISAAPGVCFLIRITYYVRFERRLNLAAP